jgi:hypothetical protein
MWYKWIRENGKGAFYENYVRYVIKYNVEILDDKVPLRTQT